MPSSEHGDLMSIFDRDHYLSLDLRADSLFVSLSANPHVNWRTRLLTQRQAVASTRHASIFNSTYLPHLRPAKSNIRSLVEQLMPIGSSRIIARRHSSRKLEKEMHRESAQCEVESPFGVEIPLSRHRHFICFASIELTSVPHGHRAISLSPSAVAWHRRQPEEVVDGNENGYTTFDERRLSDATPDAARPRVLHHSLLKRRHRITTDRAIPLSRSIEALLTRFRRRPHRSRAERRRSSPSKAGGCPIASRFCKSHLPICATRAHSKTPQLTPYHASDDASSISPLMSPRQHAGPSYANSTFSSAALPKLVGRHTFAAMMAEAGQRADASCGGDAELGI